MTKANQLKALHKILLRTQKKPDWGGDNFPLLESLPADFDLEGALLLEEEGESPFFPTMIIHDGKNFWISHESGWYPYDIHDDNPGYPTINQD